MKRILFVCAGNICRSPVAEAVVRAEFARAGVDVLVASAGTGPWHIGKPADARAQASALERGYDLSSHRARRVSADDFGQFDLLLAMDRDNLADLSARCPDEYAGKLGLFLPFAGVDTPQEVADPYYGGPEDFTRVVDLAISGAKGMLALLGMA
jgi:protein-tyrosine phosphatase